LCIAYEDALADARWRGHELPTEAQWELAARGGREGEDDWSSAFDAAGTPIANTWQGLFPVLNTEEDGYRGTAPVGCFKPNGYGLYDMIGNVWEWTSDWYRRSIHVRPRSTQRALNSSASVPLRGNRQTA
jgi:formylglycine-generating enzyme required for sulfatase activity